MIPILFALLLSGDILVDELVPLVSIASAPSSPVQLLATGKGITVAVLDTGLAIDHPHFEGITIIPFDVTDGDTDIAEVCEHGTHTTGVLTDVAPAITLLAIKIFDTCAGSYADIAAGIIYAVDHGADIISLSAGGLFDNPFVRLAVEYAYVHDVLLVSAAGNGNNNQPFYPSVLPHVLAVSGTDGADRYVMSNYGPHISVAAPAIAYTPSVEGGYDWYIGTSLAAPYVAGVAALLLEQDPTLTVSELRTALEQGAIDIGPTGRDDYFGWGSVDAWHTAGGHSLWIAEVAHD